MGCLEDDLDYMIKTYRKRLAKIYEENRGNLFEIKKVMYKEIYTNENQIESEIKFLKRVEIIKDA